MQSCRGYFVTDAIFSLAINLLYLAAPLYMLQVYDRVISSASEIIALAGLDAIRARVMTAITQARAKYEMLTQQYGVFRATEVRLLTELDRGRGLSSA